MAEFQNQPPGRSRTCSSAFNDDTLSDVSTSKDMSDALRRVHGKEAYETYKRLQSDYDELLTKYAQAENTIDQLRIGAKLNLYSDLPPPQKSSFVTVSGGKQPHVFNFQRPSQATLSSPASNVVTVQSNGTNNRSSPESDKIESDLLTPQVRAEGIRAALMFKIPTLQENVEDLQGHVTDGQWGQNELLELQDVCNQLARQHEHIKHELIQAKQLEQDSTGIDGNLSSDVGDFLHEDDLEGQLYRLGLRLDEINEQIDQNLHHFSNDSDSTVTNRISSLPKEPAKQEQMDPELSDLMRRLRDVKESAKNDDALSRSANSLADVEDLEYNEANGVQRGQDDFTLGAVNDQSDDDRDKKRDSHNGGIDLQESGYFASETMSVSHDNSDPISNHYLSNSANGHPLGERGHDESFDQQSVFSSPGRERPLSDSSIEPSPNPRRSRRTSQRSRSSTMENHATDPMTFYPQYPASPPVDPSPPQASSSILTDQSRNQPHADGRESRSRAATTDSRHSIDSNKDGRKPKHHKSQVDILRTEHDNPPDRSHDISRDRSNGYSRDRGRSVSDDISPRSRDIPAESLESSPRHEDKVVNERRPGRHRTSLSSADSRVSTPLFHPGARPKDVRRRDKVRPPTAETERGFDSGFFGSEGSRGSRFARTPEVPREPKIVHPVVREQTASESERERIRPQVAHTPVKSSKRDTRRRRSYLQSLSESDEDRDLEPSPTIVRPSSNQRDRRGHRHTPTFPATRSDNERSRRLDGRLRRPSSSPNVYELPESSVRSDLLRKSQLRPDSMRKSLTDQEKSTRLGPRSDHDTRPMDKQSMRSYPGMDRESVRSGRRSRRDDDSTSGYSDGGRKHTRDRVDKLQGELQRIRTQLQDEASARNLQAEMYGDLRRKHDDLEREIARRNAEQQMKTMYEDLQKKYEDLSKRNDQPRDSSTQVDLKDDLKRQLEELSLQVNDLRNRSVGEPGHVRFLCPFCGGCNVHHHGNYYYPGYAGIAPPNGTPGTPSHSMGTQTDGISHQTRYPSTPQATSTPYYNGYHSAPVNHYHTSTYPGGVPSGSPVHHIHHLPEGRSRDRYDDEYSSDEDDRYRSRRRGTSSRTSRRRTRDFYPEEELDSHRLHLSLDEANRAARRMQRLSKKMLNSVASDLIRSGHR